MTHRKCTSCGIEKPLTVDHWFPTRDVARHPSGFLSQCRSCRNRHKKEWYARSKLFVLERYGGTPPRCYCCGESNIGFLTLDHTNNDGAEHRRSLGGQRAGHSGTVAMLMWLKRNNYPDIGLKVACFNCNAGRHWNGGVCPHLTA